jgi:hypothetical protein
MRHLLSSLQSEQHMKIASCILRDAEQKLSQGRYGLVYVWCIRAVSTGAATQPAPVASSGTVESSTDDVRNRMFSTLRDLRDKVDVSAHTMFKKK